MLDLFRFLYKHSFIAYFIVLEVGCFALLLQNNPFQRAAFLNSSDALAAETYSFFDGVTSYLNLREVNAYLAEENSELKSTSIPYFKKTFEQNIVYQDTTFEQEYVFYKARVIKNTTNLRNNYLTLDKGMLHGIDAGMGVVTNRGIVGIVLESSKRFSTVMSILNKESKLSVRVEKNGYFGSVIWPGDDYRYGMLLDIPNHVSLLEGDLIVTSGFSGIFPEGLPVGKVLAVERKAGSGFLEVDIEFTEDYRSTTYVHVTKYLQKTERQELESSLIEND